jgi:AraC-like DNA-binding protein
MPFNFNRYSGLLLIFFIHGLVYAFLLFRKGKQYERSSDYWLGFFLLLCILYICPWMLGYAGWYNGKLSMECRNFMFYMPMQHTLLMGPVIYCYVQSLLNPAYRFNKNDAWHFLPAALYIVWTIVVAVTDRIVLKQYYLMDGQNDPDFQQWYIVAGLISLLYYLIRCLRYYNGYRRFILEELSFADSVSFRWVRNFLLACFLYFLSTLVFDVLNVFGIANDTRDAWWYYLIFAIIFYYIAITGYSNSIENRVSYRFDAGKYSQPLLTYTTPDTITEEIAYEEIPAGTAAATADFSNWKSELISIMEQGHLYRNPDLTLTELAKTMGTNASFLSKVINQSTGQNFNDFINGYRIREVQQKLADPSFSNQTIMSMAYDAGFNSKATFNRAFKKATGKNPRDFMEN